MKPKSLTLSGGLRASTRTLSRNRFIPKAGPISWVWYLIWKSPLEISRTIIGYGSCYTHLHSAIWEEIQDRSIPLEKSAISLSFITLLTSTDTQYSEGNSASSSKRSSVTVSQAEGITGRDKIGISTMTTTRTDNEAHEVVDAIGEHA